MLRQTDGNSGPRKPVVALMGEFSAGKSTLANLLIGRAYLPVQVVATRLPPVWIRHGTGPAFRVDLGGERHPVDLERLWDVPLNETAYIGLSCEEEILEQCDLIDMPGISDPNMEAEVWQRVLPQADAVLWCTHATQAWRQSEAAVWSTLPADLHRRSLLLVTRIDKLVSEKDRKKVLARLARETAGLFRDCLPISLLQATQAEEDYELWAQSGAERFARTLVDLLHEIAGDLAQGPAQRPAQARPKPEAASAFPDQTRPPTPASNADAPTSTVCPRRVAPVRRGTRTARPPAGTAYPAP